MKHAKINTELQSFIECKCCGEKYADKDTFMKHRKTKHPGTVSHCRNNAEGKCYFSSEGCWWSHAVQAEKNYNQSTCYICAKTFQKRTELMLHRKTVHLKAVRSE